MKLKIINGKTYYIFEEFVNPFGREETDFIATCDNDVLFLKSAWHGFEIVNLQSVKDEIDKLLLEKGRWRSLKRWQAHLDYYEGVKLLMIKHRRTKLINDVLKDEYYGPFDTLILAC